MADLQYKPIVIGTPIEIEKAVNDIRVMLASNLSWITHPYFIAQRFFRTDATTKQMFIYPETYAIESPGKYNYKRLTPDNDFKGMFFFLVGDEQNDLKSGKVNFLKYPVSIIFSVNLKLIDETKLNSGLFTQELIKQVRTLLTTNMMNFMFDYQDMKITRDLQNCYREFRLKELEQYNRAPMQCFRFDLMLRIKEDC